MVSVIEMQQLQDMQAVQDQREEMSKILDQEQYKFIQTLIKDDKKDVPENMPKDFWVFFDKELVLSNFTPEDIRWLMFQFDIVKLDYQMSKPDFEKTFEDMRNFTNLKVKAFSKVNRSRSPQRERELLATQIRQNIINEQSGVSGGFLSGIGKMFGGRK